MCFLFLEKKKLQQERAHTNKMEKSMLLVGIRREETNMKGYV